MRLQQLCTPEISVEDAIRSFMLHQQSSRHSPMTVRRYEYTLAQFQAFLGSQTLLDQITPSLLREYMLKLEIRVTPITACRGDLGEETDLQRIVARGGQRHSPALIETVI